MLELMFIFGVLLIGSFVQGASGFGFGMFSIGLLTFFFTVKESMLIVISLAVVLTFRILLQYWKHIIWKDLTYILSFTLLGRLAAFFFINAYGEADFLKKWLGVLLIGLVLYMYVKERRPERRRSRANVLMLAAAAGLSSGFIGGVFAVGGPFLVVYFLYRYEEKEKYQANTQAVFFTVCLFTLLLHGLNGDLHGLFGIIFGGIAFVLTGVWMGLKWFERLPVKTIQHLARAVVVLAALNLILFH